MTWAGIQGDIYNSKVDKTGEWQATLTGIPVGHVSFYAEALDKDNVVVFKVLDPRPQLEITARTTTNVKLVLQEVNAPTFLNNAPFIQSIIYSDGTIDPEGYVDLVATGGDRDAGDTVTITWTDDGGGTFTPPDALSTRWAPPAGLDVDKDFTLTLSIKDDHDALAALSLKIHVSKTYATGGLYAVIDLNNFPGNIGITTSDAEGQVGAPIALAASATDADGDDLKFAWSTNCDPAWAPEGTNVSFTPTAIGTCDFTVTVTDYYNASSPPDLVGKPRGGLNTGMLSVIVDSPVMHEGPQFYVKLATPGDIYPGQKAEVQVIPASGHAEPTWIFTWNDGGLGGVFSMRTNDGFTDFSDAWYEPFACVGAPVATTITATVTDALGATNSASLDVIVHCE